MAEERVRGIDVSHYQGVIDWTEVAKAGVEFAFTKATDGMSGSDSMFQRNWTRAQAAGLRRGAYHFFRAQQDSERQAQCFVAMLREDRGELPPVLDFETLTGACVEQALRGAQRWMEIVEEECGRKPILYTGPAFWMTNLAGSSVFADYSLWIAHYTKVSKPNVPSAWRDWTFWQYSEQGSIPGVLGPVDLDYFAGNITELDAFCGRIYQKSAAIGS
ncbi:MAG: glycoside hydrolase family 25 protein [Terriglobales bacterium]